MAIRPPFQVHADLTGQSQSFLGGQLGTGPRDEGAVLQIQNCRIPCTHSPIVKDVEFIAGGRSPATYIDQLEFLASDLPKGFSPGKGTICSLTAAPNAPRFDLMLWDGGLLPGGLVYRFRAVDKNYHA